MKILILTVCVNYIDYLSFCFTKNRESFDKHYYYIVTDSKDIATQNFCQQYNIRCFITDEFYANNQPLNRARAINTFFQSNTIEHDDFEYILFLDADCIIHNIKDPKGNSVIDAFINLPNKDAKFLYGSSRRIYNTLDDYNNNIFTRVNCNFIGFFQLFHKSKLNTLKEYKNVAVHDVWFADNFHYRYDIGLDVDHVGPMYMNWEGRQSKEWQGINNDKK